MVRRSCACYLLFTFSLYRANAPSKQESQESMVLAMVPVCARSSRRFSRIPNCTPTDFSD
jgi:hypothetical protein